MCQHRVPNCRLDFGWPWSGMGTGKGTGAASAHVGAAGPGGREGFHPIGEKATSTERSAEQKGLSSPQPIPRSPRTEAAKRCSRPGDGGGDLCSQLESTRGTETLCRAPSVPPHLSSSVHGTEAEHRTQSPLTAEMRARLSAPLSAHRAPRPPLLLPAPSCWRKARAHSAGSRDDGRLCYLQEHHPNTQHMCSRHCTMPKDGLQGRQPVLEHSLCTSSCELR